MKLFKSLLVAPATLGLLAPMSATANEVTINDFNPAEEIAVTNSRVDGLEARLNNFEAGGFSDTTTASFGVDMIVGAVDSDVTDNSEATTFDYQMGIGLSTSFTGEDSLDVTIDIGGGDPDALSISSQAMGLDATKGVLTVDGVAYSFPVGGATVLVGDATDISAVYTGACSYSAFLDYMGDCGTGNASAGTSGATAAIGYGFDGGFSLAGGISSPQSEILGEGGDDLVGLEAAYTADDFGVALTYLDAEVDGVDTTYVGLNGTYSWDVASLSVGFESEDADGSDEAFGWFAGLTFDEVGPGSLSIGMATNGNIVEDADEYYIYEASYAYPVNDGVTITPGVYTAEAESGDVTGVIVKTSFSF